MSKKIPMPSKILIVIIKDIGDVMLTEPCAQILKQNFPHAQVDILADARCAPVLEHNPFIDNIVIYDKNQAFKAILNVRKQKYDWVIDFLANPRSAMLTAFSGAKIKAGKASNKHSFYAYNFKFKNPGEYLYNPDEKLYFLTQLGVVWPSKYAPLPKYYLTKEQQDFRDKTYADIGINKEELLIGFNTTPRMSSRRWPAKQFKALAQMIYDKYKAKILVFYGPGEKQQAMETTDDMPPYIQLAPETKNLEQAFALLSRANILIAPCGGMKHMALAAGVPTVTLYTFSRAESWTPHNQPLHIAVKTTVPCSPCFCHECPKNLECMQDITPQKVFKEVQKILDK